MNPQNVSDFKASCKSLSEKFVKIDKRSHSINNLYKSRGHKNNKALDGWLPCCRLGVPCSSRIMGMIESNNEHRSKELLVACAEVKYCLLSTKV